MPYLDRGPLDDYNPFIETRKLSVAMVQLSMSEYY